MSISKVSSEQISPSRAPEDKERGVQRSASIARNDVPPGLTTRTASSESLTGASISQRVRTQLPPVSPDHESASLLGTSHSDSARFDGSAGDSSRYSGLIREALASEALQNWRRDAVFQPWARQPESSSAGPALIPQATFKVWVVPPALQQAQPTQQAQSGAVSTQSDAIQGRQPAERSWRSVASALTQELALTARSVLPQMDVVAAGRTLGAIAGHAIHQTVAVGLPTFAREMLAAGVMHGLKSAPPAVAMGLQVTVGIANFGLQVMREMRERRNPDEAARAFHSLSPEQWAALEPADQTRMREHTAKVSRAITVGQVASSMTNLALMGSAFLQGEDHRADALRPLATELKVGLYTTLRDTIQASFSMVGFDGDQTHGLAGQAFAGAAATYAGVNAGTGFLGDAMMGALVPGRGQATSTLLGIAPAPGVEPMSNGQAWGTIAQAAAVSAFTNTVGETADWFQRTQFHLSQNTVPPQQELRPAITGDDRGRVLDQAQARTALLNGINASLTAAGRAMGQTDLPSAVQGFIGNAALGALTALTDSSITGIWQAQQAVRMAGREEPVEVSVHEHSATQQPGELEMGQRTERYSREQRSGSSSEAGWRTRSSTSSVADIPSRPPRRSNTGSDPGGERIMNSARVNRVPPSGELDVGRQTRSSPPTVVDVSSQPVVDLAAGLSAGRADREPHSGSSGVRTRSSTKSVADVPSRPPGPNVDRPG